MADTKKAHGDDPIDRTIDELRRLAEAAAASVRPLDLEQYETALVRDARADLARRQAEGRRPDACVTPQGGIDFARIARLARAVSERQRRRR